MEEREYNTHKVRSILRKTHIQAVILHCSVYNMLMKNENYHSKLEKKQLKMNITTVYELGKRVCTMAITVIYIPSGRALTSPLPLQ